MKNTLYLLGLIFVAFFLWILGSVVTAVFSFTVKLCLFIVLAFAAGYFWKKLATAKT